ncbi:MAG TPA: VWA domain-containing protein [Vicinamibacteria bacterium]|nr:VWA domain-containing protein [Vicinamibacteria bacterium]
MKDVPLRLARLGRALRAHGVDTTLRDELDAAEALRIVDTTDRDEVATALRIAMRIPRAAFETFDRLFGVFWEGADLPGAVAAPNEQKGAASPVRGALHWDPDRRQLGEALGATTEGDHPGYSPEAVLRHKPFEDPWSARELVEMERLLARFARRLATRRSRRLVPTRGRGRADLRSSYRRALRTWGEVLSLARRERAVERPRLVFLVDTSGSMDACSRFLLSFLVSLRRAVPGAEAFAFNTELVRLTPWLRPGKLRLSLERLATGVPDWSGGTRIGACLDDFVRRHLDQLDARTVVVILSDGLDQGDVQLLAESLRTIAGRARRLVWLNPLLGDPRYEPAAAGMQAALPFLDHFASAHDLASLERLMPQLGI